MSVTPKSKVLKVADLVSYQEDSVVSRQIIKADAGNVTLFAFDEGQELSEHRAPFDALLHLLDGSAQVHISGRAYELAAGQAIILPANEPHSVKAAKRFKMLLTMIRS